MFCLVKIGSEVGANCSQKSVVVGVEDGESVMERETLGLFMVARGASSSLGDHSAVRTLPLLTIGLQESVNDHSHLTNDCGNPVNDNKATPESCVDPCRLNSRGPKSLKHRSRVLPHGQLAFALGSRNPQVLKAMTPRAHRFKDSTGDPMASHSVE